jgi:hypothetical protein
MAADLAAVLQRQVLVVARLEDLAARLEVALGRLEAREMSREATARALRAALESESEGPASA